MDNLDNNRRIAKNTFYLYLRLAIVLIGNLFISRIILNCLGTSDFGLNDVICGFVALFTVVSSSLTAATSRFITFELGKGNDEHLLTVFNITVMIHIILSVILLLMLETFGLWYLNNKMVIDSARLSAAHYIYQFSIISLLFTIINIPYNSVLIAHEKMDVFAFLSILDIILKVVACVCIPLFPFDSLIMYGFLLMIITLFVKSLNIGYCLKKFRECSFCYRNDKHLLRQIFAFSGWNFIGATSSILKRQGSNLVLNYFGGTLVNAAYALCMQVIGAISGFSSGILNSINPQIIKQYSVNNMDYVYKLIFYGSRISFYLVMIVSIPIFINTDEVLRLWLVNVPEYTTMFLKIAMLICLVDTWSRPLITAMLATGDIKTYQIVVGGADIMCVPFSFLLLKLGLGVYWVFILMLIISCTTLFLRMYMLKNMIKFPIISFLYSIIIKTSFVFSMALIACYITNILIYTENDLIHEAAFFILSITLSLIIIIVIDTNRRERQFLSSYFINLVKHVRG